MNPTLSALFPNASKSCRDANPEVPATLIPKSDPNETTAARKPKKRGLMNRTESEFALYLEALKRKGEILRYEFERITLRWADMRYTPDFIVFDNPDAVFESETVRHASIKDLKRDNRLLRDVLRFARPVCAARDDPIDLKLTADRLVRWITEYDYRDKQRPSPVSEDSPRIRFIEVKGNHIWDRDIVRFKGARAYWPEFAFEMHQRKAGSWKRIH